ncbi:MAG: hypothetical protein PHE17_18325 [Thiothrix sp.]|uniref:hypothetical protein n=1 Tax=Thiothrix sp. TaxID=1032 RepID=UPI0026289761|nr:hypothetical protein [Thiothrix sp.]MDD5394979.1 hypothetical protein [Thiothrix sp.]
MNTQAIRDFLGQGNRFKHRSITAYEHAVRQLFSTAGIEVGGARAFDVCVHDPRFYARVLRQGSLGLGESYMDGWWDCAAIDGLVSRLIQAELHETLKHHPEFWLQALRARLFNL